MKVKQPLSQSTTNAMVSEYMVTLKPSNPRHHLEANAALIEVTTEELKPYLWPGESHDSSTYRFHSRFDIQTPGIHKDERVKIRILMHLGGQSF